MDVKSLLDARPEDEGETVTKCDCWLCAGLHHRGVELAVMFQWLQLP